jgi:hypothetical protein
MTNSFHDAWHLLTLWARIHPLAAFLFALGIVAHLVVALTPMRLQKNKWFGWALWITHRLVFSTHSDQPGSVQIPIIARPILWFVDEAVPEAVGKPVIKEDPPAVTTAGATEATPAPAAAEEPGKNGG